MATVATIKVPYTHAEDHAKVDALCANPAYLADAATGVREALQLAADRHGPKHGLHGLVTVGEPTVVSIVHS